MVKQYTNGQEDNDYGKYNNRPLYLTVVEFPGAAHLERLGLEGFLRTDQPKVPTVLPST